MLLPGTFRSFSYGELRRVKIDERMRRRPSKLVGRSTRTPSRWRECESLAKDLSQDALKSVVEMGASAAVLNYVLNPCCVG
jgi:hypothetical protein